MQRRDDGSTMNRKRFSNWFKNTSTYVRNTYVKFPISPKRSKTTLMRSQLSMRLIRSSLRITQLAESKKKFPLNNYITHRRRRRYLRDKWNGNFGVAKYSYVWTNFGGSYGNPYAGVRVVIKYLSRCLEQRSTRSSWKFVVIRLRRHLASGEFVKSGAPCRVPTPGAWYPFA